MIITTIRASITILFSMNKWQLQYNIFSNCIVAAVLSHESIVDMILPNIPNSTNFYINKRRYPKSLDGQMRSSVELMEKQLGKKLGDTKKPLLLSVRSGAGNSMPGMMDTIIALD